MKEYCGNCEDTVEFEEYDGSYYCCACGYSKGTESNRIRSGIRENKQMERKDDLKKVGWVLLVVVIIIGVAFRPDKAGEVLAKGLAKGVGIAVVLGMIYGIGGLIGYVSKKRKS